MKTTKKKSIDLSPEEAIELIQEIFKKRGSKALEIARREILKEKIECKEAREALTYFMTEYWDDLARPSLLSLVCEAVGGDSEITTPIAVSMILISGAIDIHDDIIDQSETKEDRPTVLGKFGKDIALLVGDALFFKGFSLLYEALENSVPSEKRDAIIKVVKEMFFELGDAEAQELRFRGRLDITPEDYLQVVKKKGADVEAYTRISAILGGASKREVESLAGYGRFLGMLAVLRDDVADMMDYQELLHRLKYECLPLPMLYALQNPAIKSSISSIFLKKKILRKDAELIFESTKKAGGMAQLEKLMKEIVEDGCSKLKFVKFNKEELMLLIRSML